MNELLFFGHILAIIAFLFVALKRGESALTMFIALQVVFANLFVVKQMNFFGLDVTCSDVYAIGSLLSLNVLQEYFGRDAAKKAIGISFLACVFFALMANVHLLYVPSAFDQTHGAFAQIFASTPRIITASLFVYWVVQQFDVRLFTFLQGRLKAFPIRVAISLVISQVIDTVLFSFLGLYGLVHSLLDIIMVSLITKWVAIGCSVPFTTFLKSRKIEARE